MDTNESLPLPESSFISTIFILNRTIISTLNYTLEMPDLFVYSRIHIVCIATNTYGTSEQHFTLSLNSSKIAVTQFVTPTPSVTLSTESNYSGNGIILIIILIAIIMVVSMSVVVMVCWKRRTNTQEFFK